LGGADLLAKLNSPNNKACSSIEAVIKKICKLGKPEIQEIKDNEITITTEDCSLIEIDIIIDVCGNLNNSYANKTI
jgi:hypothetical protein